MHACMYANAMRSGHTPVVPCLCFDGEVRERAVRVEEAGTWAASFVSRRFPHVSHASRSRTAA